MYMYIYFYIYYIYINISPTHIILLSSITPSLLLNVSLESDIFFIDCCSHLKLPFCLLKSIFLIFFVSFVILCVSLSRPYPDILYFNRENSSVFSLWGFNSATACVCHLWLMVVCLLVHLVFFMQLYLCHLMQSYWLLTEGLHREVILYGGMDAGISSASF